MKDKLIKVLEEVLETSVDTDASKDFTENWDSLNHVRIIVEIQHEFDIKIPEDKINELTSFQKLLEYIQSQNK